MSSGNQNQTTEYRSRSPIRYVFDVLSTGTVSSTVPGVRGRPVYLADNGFTYVQNKSSTNSRQLRCTRYESGCRGTASMALVPENAPIRSLHEHNHLPNNDVEIGSYNTELRNLASTESTQTRIILEDISSK
ncbi:uncharacterized protein LOC126903139 isoform X2 [Daktulosphaira vitifoliae]|nr:uncharacterized protein LOC126903139 isoform X2 [Daktulosphaira vitifoliae]